MVNSPVTLFLEAVTPSEYPLVGERSQALSSLMRIGFPVPDGFTVTTDAWAECIEAPSVWRDISKLMDGLGQVDEDEFRKRASMIRELADNCVVPEHIVEDIRIAYTELGEGDQFVEVAVRSSVAGDYGAARTPPGIFDSYLCVQGIDSLLKAIRRVWAGAFNDRALRHLARTGFLHKPFRMAVLTQIMMPAEITGLLYTCDNTTGDRSRAIIHARSGNITEIAPEGDKSEIFVVNQNNWELEERRLVGSHMSGLSEDMARSLAVFGRRVEEHFGSPQRIDWCSYEGSFHVLDSRPAILTATACSDRPWSRFLTAELLPGPMTPLTRSVVLPLFENALKSLFGLPRKGDIEDFDFVSDVRGHLYLNARAIHDHGPDWVGYFHELSADWSGIESGETAPAYPDFRRLLGMLWQLEWRMRRMKVDTLRVIDEADAAFHHIRMADIRGKSDAALYIIMERLLDDAIEPVARLYMEAHMTCVMAHTLLRGALHLARVDDPAATHADLQAIPDADRTAIDSWKISRLADAIGGIVDKLREVDEWTYFRPYLDRIEGGKLFSKRLESFMKIHGAHTEQGLELAAPRWRDRPAELKAVMTAFVRLGESIEPVARSEKVLTRSRELARKVKTSSGPLRKWLLKSSRKHAFAADKIKLGVSDLLDRTFNELRGLMLDVGLRFVDRKHIADADDIFFLTMAELRKVLALREKPERLFETAHERKANYVYLRENPGVPAFISGNGTDKPGDRADVRRGPNNKIGGVGVSSGVYTGKSRVLRGIPDLDRVETGDVAVMPSLPEAMIPVAAMCGAMVIETGGFTSPGAMAARGLGLPCVMAVRNACNLIADGDIITVDGTKGELLIVGRHQQRQK